MWGSQTKWEPPPSSRPPPTGAGFCCQDPGGGLGPTKPPVMAESPGCCLPRNVLCERERRWARGASAGWKGGRVPEEGACVAAAGFPAGWGACPARAEIAVPKVKRNTRGWVEATPAVHSLIRIPGRLEVVHLGPLPSRLCVGPPHPHPKSSGDPGLGWPGVRVSASPTQIPEGLRRLGELIVAWACGPSTREAPGAALRGVLVAGALAPGRGPTGSHTFVTCPEAGSGSPRAVSTCGPCCPSSMAGGRTWPPCWRCPCSSCGWLAPWCPAGSSTR